MPATTALLVRVRRRITVRTIDEIEVVVSVLLAIAVAHRIGATNVSWAAFSGYMVMRGHVFETVQRGILRIVGTLAGGLLALAVIPPIAPHWPLAALGILVIGTVTLCKAITARRAYAWLFVGLTFAMVLFDTLHDPAIPLATFVRTRVLEVIAGTAARVAVSLLTCSTCAAANGIEHRLTKVRHFWTNGQVERMNRTIKEATVKRYHYDSHRQLETHLCDFVDAYNYGRRLKTLKGLTPFEYICKIWTSDPERCTLDPTHQMLGLNT